MRAAELGALLREKLANQALLPGESWVLQQLTKVRLVFQPRVHHHLHRHVAGSRNSAHAARQSFIYDAHAGFAHLLRQHRREAAHSALARRSQGTPRIMSHRLKIGKVKLFGETLMKLLHSAVLAGARGDILCAEEKEHLVREVGEVRF